MPLDLRGIISWDDKSGPTLNQLESRLQKLSRAGAWMTAAGAAITTAIGGSMTVAAKYGDEIQKAALKTSMTTEEISKLRYAAEQSGVSLQGLESSVSTMIRTAGEAVDGNEQYAESYKALGVSVTDSTGNMRSANDIFMDAVGALSSMENKTLMAARAQEIFGGRGRQLLPLLAAGKEGVAALGEEARKTGLVWSQEAADSAAAYNDALNRMKLAGQGLGQTLVVTLGPAITDIANSVADAMGAFRLWADEHPGMAKTIVWGVGLVGAALGVGGPILMALPSLLAGLRAVQAMFTRTAAVAEASAATTSTAAGQMAAAGAGAQATAGAGAVGGAAAGGAAARGIGAGAGMGIGGALARGGVGALWAAAAYSAYRTGSYVYSTGREAIEAKGAQQVYEQYQREGRSAEEIARAKAVFQREAGEFGMRATDVPFRGLFNQQRLRVAEEQSARLLQQAESAGFASQRYPRMVVEVRLSGEGNIAETMLKDPQAREEMSRFIGGTVQQAAYAPR